MIYVVFLVVAAVCLLCLALSFCFGSLRSLLIAGNASLLIYLDEKKVSE